MGGIIKDFALTALIIILNHWVYGVEDTFAYDYLIDLIHVYRTPFLAIGFLGSAALLLSSTMFESLGLYKITYGLSKLSVRISQFFITFVAILNIVFYAAIGDNFLRDNGYLILLVLFLILGASCWAIRIIDFNYHTKNAVLPAGLIALVSILLVEIVWPLVNF